MGSSFSEASFSVSSDVRGKNAAIGTHVENQLSSLAFITEIKKFVNREKRPGP